MPFLVALLALGWAPSARAASWCASPLVVHEWGVALLRADGARVQTEPLPSWFHQDRTSSPLAGSPVRLLPPDTGIRRLPVVQIYGAGPGPIPLALEVSFAQGDPLAWFPAVDQFQDGATARSPAALAARQRLLAARATRTPYAPSPLGADPTRQLGWDALTASEAPSRPPHPQAATDPSWVESLRSIPSALWIGRGEESDRFVFYEGTTHAPPAVQVQSLPGARDGQVLLRNVSDWEVHDVVLIAGGRAAMVPVLPAGGTATVNLAPTSPDALSAWLRSRWVDGVARSLSAWDSGNGDCVMMRDAALPVDKASGYRLYPAEVDLLLSVWADALAETAPHLVYREDTAALEVQMPLSVYTDMYHYPELHRLGVVVVDGLTAP